MIRKPEAKRQAELIISELAGRGLALQRGHALELVAKLQGFQGWNEYIAAPEHNVKDSPKEHKPEAQPSVPAAYFVGDLSELASRGANPLWVSAIMLADHLSHATRDTCTILYEGTSANGGVHELRLCGFAEYELTRTGAEAIRTSCKALTVEHLKFLGWTVECINEPYFEWINELGDPILSAFTILHTDVEHEISLLQRTVERIKLQNLQ